MSKKRSKTSSEIPESKNYITDSELKQIGVSREIWEDWYLVMDTIWVVFNKISAIQSLENVDNEIRFKTNSGSAYAISASMVNNSYVEVCLMNNEGAESSDPMLTAIYKNNHSAIISALLCYLGIDEYVIS